MCNEFELRIDKLTKELSSIKKERKDFEKTLEGKDKKIKDLDEKCQHVKKAVSSGISIEREKYLLG